jgi:glycosyltransferase involved in cell wall biosynthesis
MNLRREPLIVAVIPAYNEEARIAKVVMQAQPYVNKVIVCDDGSDDLTAEIAKALGATVVKHRQNLGYGAALLTLFREARKLNPDAAITLDGDGQHDPKYIPELVKPILKGKADLVIGSRFLSEESKERLPPYREMGIDIITRLTNRASYGEITDAQSGFRAYGIKALQTIRPTEQGMGISTEILLKAKQANLAIKEMPMVISYNGNTSKKNPMKHWTDVVLTTYKLMALAQPMIFIGVPALVTLIVSLGLGVRVVTIFSATGRLSRDTVIMALGSLIIGIVLLTTAVVLSILAHGPKRTPNKRASKR